METVTLRRFELADADAMMAWASDPEVTAFMAWEPSESVEHLRAFIGGTVLPHPWFRAICLAGPGASPGVATAALKRALATAFADLPGVERVEALVDVDNAASRRALEKAGFHQEAVLRSYCVVNGRLRDMVIYSFISTDPLVE
uniref:N-acetyltransferase domain-containing protein n=1 Tax=Oryza brachyantha TaxID=4533 RepID=J3LTM8_ORYBR